MTLSPQIDSRNALVVLKDLYRRLPGYTPEWQPPDGDNSPPTASALLKIYARYLEIFINGLNKVPDQRLVAFLDMLGTHLLPAQAAEVPLVFSMIENSPIDVVLPKFSQVAASVYPAPLTLKTGSTQTQQPVLFSTTQNIILTRAKLSSVYSIDPRSDEYDDHTPYLASGFVPFQDLKLVEHTIYLGHNQLFAYSGDIAVVLSFTLSPLSDQAFNIQWEYLSQAGWIPFSSTDEEDSTCGLTKNGQVILRKSSGPAAKQDTFFNHTSYWLRGRIISPLLPASYGGPKTLPAINTIRTRVQFHKEDVSCDAAFNDEGSIDLTKDFYPFGHQPTRSSIFYIACQEIFQREKALVHLNFSLSQQGRVNSAVRLTWEYFNGLSWKGLSVDPSVNNEPTYKFDQQDGTVSFNCPGDWAETVVNGVKNYWSRCRIIAGDYGYPLRLDLAPTCKILDVANDKITLTVDTNQGYTGGESVILKSTPDRSDSNLNQVIACLNTNQLVLGTAVVDVKTYKNGTIAAASSTPTLLPSSMQPPVISKLTLAYEFSTDPELPDQCLSENNFVFTDHSDACRWHGQAFSPFCRVDDIQPAVYFSFDRCLPAGLVSLYIDIALNSSRNLPQNISPFTWEYESTDGWIELNVIDETVGFQQSGVVQFIGPPDAISSIGPGGELYRIRARLKQNEGLPEGVQTRVWLNAVKATQRSPHSLEIIGVSDGNPRQTFFTIYKPVLDGEKIEVKEWSGDGEIWKMVVDSVPPEDLRYEYKPSTGEVQAVWVSWHAQKHLFNSKASDRNYMIERATGWIRFGDGRYGRIPPAGSQIVITYDSGGGLAGNLPSGAITELHTAVPYLMKVTNPVPATGGTDGEEMASAIQRGPQQLRHRNRAVTISDFEWLAREASPDVANVRCLPNTGPNIQIQRGWVSLIILPKSTDPQPQLTPELSYRVLAFLAQRNPAVATRKIRILAPQFIPIRVQAEIVPIHPDESAQVEANVRDRLNRYFHPGSGGDNQRGWAFGQSVVLSRVAWIIKETPGVETIHEVSLSANGQLFGDILLVENNVVVSTGNHELKLIVGEN